MSVAAPVAAESRQREIAFETGESRMDPNVLKDYVAILFGCLRPDFSGKLIFRVKKGEIWEVEQTWGTKTARGEVADGGQDRNASVGVFNRSLVIDASAILTSPEKLRYYLGLLFEVLNPKYYGEIRFIVQNGEIVDVEKSRRFHFYPSQRSA